MKILGIETSCDETAISIIEIDERSGPAFKILANVLISQIKIHEQYGGVFPMVAKREHAKNLTPLLHKAMLEAGFMTKAHDSKKNAALDNDALEKIRNILTRENGLYEQLADFLLDFGHPTPPIDAIAVTSGPGLEPALWVGISFAKALGTIWDIPVVPVNHMEGHIVGSLLEGSAPQKTSTAKASMSKKSAANVPMPSRSSRGSALKSIHFPAIALLISGGHTELVEISDWRQYKLIGKTRDDAVGEAFDKVARLLGLPYPGGPEISMLAEHARQAEKNKPIKQRKSDEKTTSTEQNDPTVLHQHAQIPIILPRPMIHSGDLDFSFSGLKTAVLYLLKKISDIDAIGTATKQEIAREFEDAVTDTLIAKTELAIDRLGVQTLILGGGVVANTHIRKAFESLAEKRSITLYLPNKILSTDNALMIAIAGYFVFTAAPKDSSLDDLNIKAMGNLSL